ncbi:nuclear transport factor 2 family protein, partial [Striga asiatica]
LRHRQLRQANNNASAGSLKLLEKDIIISIVAMDPEAVSKAFVAHYYTTFDQNRAALANLYQEASMLTFEGQKFQGPQQITAKLTGLPFQQCQHQVSTVDCQHSGPAGGMLVFVSGNLQIAGEQHPLKFSQASFHIFCSLILHMFHLMPTPQGGYYVLNDIFRLNYA